MLHTAAVSDGAEATHTSAKAAAQVSKKLIFAPGEGSQVNAERISQAAQFKIGTLNRSDLDSSPFKQFHKWFADPKLVGSVPETCILSTASLPSGRVSARVVYLKELDERGFVVYSNWGTSRKSKDWESNKWCSLTFWWKGVERQVRVEGKGERLSKEESQLYFDTRARGSRIGAWASKQSVVLEPRPQDVSDDTQQQDTEEGKDDGRNQLKEWYSEEQTRWEGNDKIDVPDHWGGLRIVPVMMEFWQGRESRLHDRFTYERESEGDPEWKIQRLSP